MLIRKDHNVSRRNFLSMSRGAVAGTVAMNSLASIHTLRQLATGQDSNLLTSIQSNLSVALTLDDGTANQAQAIAIANKRGLKLTLFVNSSRVNLQGYLTLNQLRQIQAQGHEITGHTLNHLNLTTLSELDARHQICRDRQNLINWGFTPQNFAYPFGAANKMVEQLVADCGYRSARIVGGLSCGGCPAAITLPISSNDQFIIPTPGSVRATTTLTALQNLVIKAEAVGGFLPLVFHHISSEARFDPYRITPANFDAFMAFLQSRSVRGTVVRTLREIVGEPPSAADRSRYGFEYGLDGWVSSGGMITGVSSSSAQAFAGIRSLAVHFEGAFADTQQVYVSSPATPPNEIITFRVWIPANNHLTAVQPYVLQNEQGGWKWTGNFRYTSGLKKSAWNELQVKVPSNASPLYSLGVEFTTDGAFSGIAFVDSIDW